MSESESELDIAVCAARRALAFARQAVRGARTLILCAVFGVLGVADMFNEIDIGSLLRMAFGDTPRVGFSIVCLTVLFALLRVLTRGPIGSGWRDARRNDDGDVS